MKPGNTPLDPKDIPVMSVDKFEVSNKGLFVSPGVLLDVKHLQTNGEIRLRHSEIKSWTPFRYTVLKEKTVDFFYCHRCFLFFDAIRSVQTLEGESRHCCLDCGSGTVLSACFTHIWESQKPKSKSQPFWHEITAVEDAKKEKPTQEKELKLEVKSEDRSWSPWFTYTYDTSDDWVLSFWCECGRFNSGHHPPRRLGNQQNHCLCGTERPAKMVGWQCISCNKIHPFLTSTQPETVKCLSCQTLFHLDGILFIEFRRGFLLDFESNIYWKKKSSSSLESRSEVKSQFEVWIKLWQARFLTCEEFREAQVKEMSRIQHVDDISDLDDVKDGKLLIRYVVALFAAQILDFILATKIQTLWKLRIREQEQHDLDNDLQELDDWGELDDSTPMLPVEVKSVKLSCSVNQALEQKLLKLLVDLTQNPSAYENESLTYLSSFVLAKLDIPIDLIHVIHTYLLRDPIPVRFLMLNVY
jgi:hypothetical protein